METMEKTNQDIKNSIADDYIETCLENERGFYEYVKKDKFSLEIIKSGVYLWSDYLANSLLKYHDIKDIPYERVNSFWGKEALDHAVNELYKSYEEERETT